MTLGHERLDVYRLSIGYVAWVYEKAKGLNGVHRPARDQWLGASQSISIPIPIAISIWRRSSPNHTFQATLYSAPERTQAKPTHRHRPEVSEGSHRRRPEPGEGITQTPA